MLVGTHVAAVSLADAVGVRGPKLCTFVARENAKDLLTLTELIESGKLAPIIDRSYRLSDAPAAIRYLETGHARGRIVITVAQPSGTPGYGR